MAERKQNWREDPNEELARLINRRELSTFWKTNIDLILGPNESLVWIRDGKIEDTITQARLRNVAGGFKNWLSAKLNVGKEVYMMIVDNKPFDIQIGIEGVTGDGVMQEGVAKATLRLNYEQAARIIGVLREREIKVKKGFFRKKEVVKGHETKLTRTDIEQMVAAEAQVKVFKPLVKRYQAEQFGGKEVADRVASTAQIEMRKTLETWGMSIENIYVNWNTNAYQTWKAERAPSLWNSIAQREDEISAAQHGETLTDVSADAQRERIWKDEQARLVLEQQQSHQDLSELDGLMGLKERMNQQKLARMKAESDADLAKTRVEAGAQVESAKYNLETFKDAQATESEKMLRMMEIMQGQKKRNDDD